MGKVLVFGGGFVGLIWALYSALCVVVVAPQIAAPVVVEIAAQPIPPQPTLAPVLPAVQLVPWVGVVNLADVLVIPEGAVQTGTHAGERHTEQEADAVRAAVSAAIAANPILGQQPPCKDGRHRFIVPMGRGGWGVWVVQQVGERLFDEITAFKTSSQDYVRGVHDDCGNGSWFGHSFAQ